MKKIQKYWLVLAALFTVLLYNGITVSAADNIAAGREAFASSKYTEDEQFEPGKVTDGDYNSMWSMGSVTLTGEVAGYQYVAVDLGDQYVLDSVKTVTRRELDQPEARTGWIIQAANNRDFSDAVVIGKRDTPGAYKEDYVFICETGAPFRYVRVASANYFVVAEIEVYGEKYDPATMNKKSAFTDTAEKKYNGAAALLSYLNIMEGANSTEFGGERLLTRAQAAKTGVALVGGEIAEAGRQIYEDIPAGHWAEDYVYTAYLRGIVSHDAVFRPDDFVTDQEFLKMVLYAMGYDTYIQQKGGYPSGVYAVAGELRLLRNAGVKNGENISRGQAAIILYNALDAPLCDQVNLLPGGMLYYTQNDEKMLETIFNMRVQAGVMTENSATSLVRGMTSGAGHVKVDGRAYVDQSGQMELWIGKSVGIAVDIDAPEIVLAAWENTLENQITTVMNSQFMQFEGGYYWYEDETARKKRIRISAEAYVIKNNTAVTDWTESDLICPDGYIDFIDNNDDGTVEVAVVYEPRVFIADYVSSSDGVVSVAGKNGETVTAGDLNYLSIKKNGKNSSAGKIAEYDVVYVYLSADEKTMVISAYSDKRVGKVEVCGADKIVFDGMEIEYSQYYTTHRAETDALEAGKTATILLNPEGRLVWIVKDSTVSSDDVIGFVCQVRQPEDYEMESSRLRIYSQYGAFNNYSLADKVRLDGKSVKRTKLEEQILSGNLTLAGQFVMYSLNGDGDINRLDTEKTETGEQNSKIVKYTGSIGSNVIYAPKAEGIYNLGWLVLPMRSNTPSFSVPVVGGIPGGTDFEKYYQVSTAERIFPNLVQITEKTAFYGLDENGYPSFAVKYKPYTVAGEGGLTPIDDEDAYGLLITGISQGLSEEDMPTYQIRGYDILTGKELEFPVAEDIKRFYMADDIQAEQEGWLDDSKFIDPSAIDQTKISQYTGAVSELKKGDVIRFQVQGGEISALERIFAAYSGKNGEYTVPDGNYYSASDTFPPWPTATFRLVYGLADGIQDNVLKVKTSVRNGAGEKMTENIAYKKLSYLFVCENGKTTKYSASALPSYAERGCEVVLYTKTGSSISVILYR